MENIFLVVNVAKNQKKEWGCFCGKKSVKIIIYKNNSHKFLCKKCFNKIALEKSLTEDQKKGLIILKQ